MKLFLRFAVIKIKFFYTRFPLVFSAENGAWVIFVLSHKFAFCE